MSVDTNNERLTSNERVAFDDNVETAKRRPQESEHWQSLVHQDSDLWIHSIEDMKERFRNDVRASKTSESSSNNNNNNGGETMAIWSCVSGYCEALATHKDDCKRYSVFPVPIDALVRLVRTEFWDRVLLPAEESLDGSESSKKKKNNNNNTDPSTTLLEHQKHHRAMVREVANAVWDTAIRSSKKDEEHANSLYVCLRGNIDRKSIDCVGSSVTTVAGVKLLQQKKADPTTSTANVVSMLTLSEDHAYEKHILRVSAGEGTSDSSKSSSSLSHVVVEGTCEVAIPGSTNRQKAKRACEIADTFRDKKACVLLTPETSWLYMAKNPVVCSNVAMSLVPIIANMNCNIRSKPPGSSNSSKGSSIESKQLYRLKRELLWILYDEGAMAEFPFGILELGDCEATVGSKRGEEWVVSKSPLVEHSEPILRNEELFLEAIEICKRKYEDSQVYPYYYLGHYHKDAGGVVTETSPGSSKIEETTSVPVLFSDNEHRFADALRMYSEMARVTSKYRFDTGDCLQLNKHLTAVAPLIYEDILTTKAPDSESPKKTSPSRPARNWIHDSNARACCFWLLRFLDSLLHWEEWSSSAASKAGLTSKNPRFVEILQPSHKAFVGKLLQTFSETIRGSALDDFFAGKTPTIIGSGEGAKNGQTTNAPTTTIKFPVSKRLGSGSTLLSKALRSTKIQIRDLELMIVDDDDSLGRGRSSKRRRRS